MSYFASLGSKMFIVTGTTALYPTDGEGGTTTTAADSSLFGAHLCVIDGFVLLSHDAGGDLIFVDENDDEVHDSPFTIPDAAEVGKDTNLFALERNGIIGARVDAAGPTASYAVFYRLIFKPQQGM